MRIRHGLFLMIALAWAVPAEAAGHLTVQTQHLDRKAANYEITIMYPHTGVAQVDDQVAQWAKSQADTFMQNAADKQPGESAWTLDVSYTITRNDSEMFGTLFEYDTYTGGAHPNMEYYTFNFLCPTVRPCTRRRSWITVASPRSASLRPRCSSTTSPPAPSR